MKAAIFGTGRMGKPTAWAMEKLRYDLILMDSSRDSLKECDEILNQDAELRFIDTPENLGLPKVLHRPYPDIVISSLPYDQNLPLAKYCVKNSIRYCDLGGNTKISNQINNFAKQYATKPVMTDLGVAPGLVNILTEAFYNIICKENKDEPPESVNMMVGGIPVNEIKGNQFNYCLTWSIDGLINEYTDTCLIVKDGNRISVPALSGYAKVNTKSLGQLEGFYTSGGSSHTIERMIKLKVKNITYRTLRWPGHHQTIDLLINQCGLDKETLKPIFKRTCGSHNVPDVVMVYISIDDKVQEMLIPADDQFTAMQRATGFSIACAAALIGDGTLDHKKSLAYEDIPFDKFNNNMESLLPQEEQV